MPPICARIEAPHVGLELHRRTQHVLTGGLEGPGGQATKQEIERGPEARPAPFSPLLTDLPGSPLALHDLKLACRHARKLQRPVCLRLNGCDT